MRTESVSTIPLALDRKVAWLRDPATYPERPGRIETIETHMSWVFLTERHVYKLKKPVRHDFLDYSTLAAREYYCREEVRLNRPLAPRVYLGVVALGLDEGGTAKLDASGTVVDWLVKMRRLPATRLLDHCIRAGDVRREDIVAVAERLAAFYRTAAPAERSGAAYRASCAEKIEENRRVLASRAYGLSAAQVARVHDWLRHALEASPQAFEQRAEQGRIVEGHGDLRPEHVCLESPPVIFDRLEFSRRLRIVDPLEELCFLSLECARLGAGWIGELMLSVYERVAHDEAPPLLKRFYTAQRACIRARLAALHTADTPSAVWPKWLSAAQDYLDRAERSIESR